jgi:phage head maturation protease
VSFEFEAPKCDIGDRCLELVRTGVFSGCSFEFYPQDYEIEENGDEVKITHTRFRMIGALTIGMDPAYMQTSVNARELVDAAEKRSAQELEKKKAAEEAEEKLKREAALRKARRARK